MKLTKKKAKELSILKWECIINENKGNSLTRKQEKLLGINELRSECGYCEKYCHEPSALSRCAKCPISPKIKDWDDFNNVGCWQYNHPFATWVNTLSIKNAQAVLDLIKNS